MRSRLFPSLLFTLGLLVLSPLPAAAQDRLCDPGDEDCRAILINYIRNETVGIDVGFWFMEDARYTAELTQEASGRRPGPGADGSARERRPTRYNAARLNELQTAGIPMRKRLTSYILHWKMMLFHGQNVVEFSGANYSADAWRPGTAIPYENYTDEAIYFTSDTAIVNSFRTKFDDHWVNTTEWADYANITDAAGRVTTTSFRRIRRSTSRRPRTTGRGRSTPTRRSRRKIDAIMYRITDRQHTDTILATVARGVPVRLITEPVQYRLESRMWHSWNVDRLYMGGVQIKHRAHAGLNHQKSVILYDQNGTLAGDQTHGDLRLLELDQPVGVAARSSTTSSRPSRTSSTWFVNQFERKWNNTGGIVENADFVPLPPGRAEESGAGDRRDRRGDHLTLKWFGGPWAHLYDLYSTPTPAFTNPHGVHESGRDAAEDRDQHVQLHAAGRRWSQGTTYYWKVVGKTMALQTKTSAVWSFTTAGVAPPPPPTGTAEIVLYASKAPLHGRQPGRSSRDSTAAGGAKIRHPNAGAAKITTASATPANYFELTFNAAGRASAIGSGSAARPTATTGRTTRCSCSSTTR